MKIPLPSIMMNSKFLKILLIIFKLLKMKYYTLEMPTKLIDFYPYIIASFKTNDLISTEVRIRLLFIFIFSIISSFFISMSPSSSILTSQLHLSNSIHLSSLSINAVSEKLPSHLPEKVHLPIALFQDALPVFLALITLGVPCSETGSFTRS